MLRETARCRIPGSGISRSFSSAEVRKEAHTIKATLKEVAKYDDETKIGLKVFHLQSLSFTSMREAGLLSNERYQSLKASIFSRQGMKSLSPAQTVAAIASLGRLESADRRSWSVACDALKTGCESDTYRMSPSQIAVSLFSIARSGSAVCAKDVVMRSCFNRMLEDSNSWSAIDMGWVLYFMRHKGSRDTLPAWSKMLNQIAYRFNERLSQMTPKNIACILSEFGSMGYLPGSAIHRALQQVTRKMNRLDSKSVCLLLSALAKMKVFQPNFLHSVSDHILRSNMVPNMQSRQCALVLLSLSKLDFVHKPVVTALLARTGSLKNEWSESDLAMIAYAMGRMGIVPPLWHSVVEAFTDRIESMSPQNISVVMMAISKSGIAVSPSVFSKVENRVSSDIQAFTQRQIVNILYSFALSGYVPNALRLPKNGVNIAEKNEFQLALIKLSSGVTVADQAPVVMHPKTVTPLHSKIEESLQLCSSVDSVEVCKKIGSVWVDIAFETNQGKFALLFLSDGGRCKLDPSRLLGFTKWTIAHVESGGYTAVVVDRKHRCSWVDGLPEPVKAEVRMSGSVEAIQVRRKKPFKVDPVTGKVSFRRSSGVYLVR